MVPPKEEAAMECANEQQTTSDNEPSDGADRPPPPSSRSRLSAMPIPESLYRLVGTRGLHRSFTRSTGPRLFPESLYRYIHDGALHRYMAGRFWLRFWLLPAAFFALSLVLVVLLAPVIVFGRARHLAREGRLPADLGRLSWYAPFLPLICAFLSLNEMYFYCHWVKCRRADTQHFGPTYRFPVLYVWLRVVENCMVRLLPSRVLRKKPLLPK